MPTKPVQSKKKTFVRKKTTGAKAPARKTAVKRVVKETVLQPSSEPVISETQEMLSAVTEPAPVPQPDTKPAPVEEEPVADVSNAEAAVIATKAQDTEDTAKEAAEPPAVRKSRKKAMWLSVALLVFLVLAGAGTYLLLSVSKPTDSKNPKDIVERVGRLVILPTNETPTVAVVSDTRKLPKVPLFADAENGDRVLIYPTAKRAFLYRPSLDRLVAMSDVSIQTQSGTDTQAKGQLLPTPSPTPAQINVSIYNGTNTAGLAKTSSKDLESKNKTIIVVSTSDAKKKPYTKTLVIDLTEKDAAGAKMLAGLVGGTVSALPAGETAPNGAQYLIILGTDYAQK